MKKANPYFPFLLFAVAALIFTSCRKDNSAGIDNSVSAEDNSSVSAAINASIDDASNTIENVATLTGKNEETHANPCGYTIDLTDTANGIITVNYNGDNCNNIKRTGTLKITLLDYTSGKRWRDAGAVLKLELTNHKVTHVTSGGYFTLNGTHYVTNVNGGSLVRMVIGLENGPIVRKHVADNFTLTWADGSQRTWSVRRTRTFTKANNVITMTLSGDTTLNGVANSDIWGTNRHGQTFASALTAPIVANSTCGFYKPVSGQLTHKVDTYTVDIQYGVDATGQQVNSGCAFGYEITYTNGNKNRTRVVSYWF